MQQKRGMMKKYLELLRNTVLFKEINDKDLESMLKCLNARKQSYPKNEVVIMADNEITAVGIVLNGTIQILKEDISGDRIIVDELNDGDLFAETFVCAGVKKSPVTVQTVTPCEIMFIDYNRIITTCSAACSFHTNLIQNMIKLIAQKNIMLNSKLDIISKKTTREKLFAYFAIQMNKSGGNKFEIPFSRDELADYLCVNRSAMSRELCKMRDENIILFNKGDFEIL